MLNQLVLVGRLVDKPTVEEMEDGRKVSYIKVAVLRNYKNADGEYLTDVIPITLYNGIAENTESYCNKGDLIGFKGRVEENEENIILVAEKITFLSSKSEKEEE